MSQWKSNDDFELDLREFSDINVSADEAYEPPPPTIAQYSARMKQNTKSVFDSDDYFNYDEDEVTHVYSGRGRGCVSKIFIPGKAVSQAANDEESIIVRKIKEETGFIGYDQIVETKYKKLFEDAKEPQSVILPTVEKQWNSSSVSITPVFSSKNKFPNADKVPSDSTVTPTQLPLSVIMQRAKKKHEDMKLKSESDNSGSDSASTKENSSDNSMVNGKNRKNTQTTPILRSKHSDKQWRSLDTTESRGDKSTVRASAHGHFAEYVKSDYVSRNKKLFDVQSETDFPPLGK